MPTQKGHTRAIPASKVKGTTVYNTAGENIGQVEDIILDKTSNNIMFAVLGFGGFLSVDCPPSIRPAAGVGRAVVAMTEHALELACNRSTCTRAEIEVAAKGKAFEAKAYLQNVVDPFLQIDEEVRWHVVRGACQLAGGEAHIELASDERQGTILRAHFV